MNNHYIIHKPSKDNFYKDNNGTSRDTTEQMGEQLWNAMDGHEYSEMPGLTDDKGIEIMHNGTFYHIPFGCVTRVN